MKGKATTISNLIKIGIVLYIFFEYHYQSVLQNSPLSADSSKGLLFVAMAGFLILLPVDGSIFIKNFFNAKDHIVEKNKKDKK